MTNTSLKNKTATKKAVTILAAVLVFTLCFLAAYLVLGNKVPGGKKVWAALANILPLPVASVDGHDVRMQTLRAAQRLAAPDALDFVIRQTAIKAVADAQNISASELEVAAYQERLRKSWGLSEADYQRLLNEKKVSEQSFKSLFVRPDVLEQKLALNLNKTNLNVLLVESKLKNGDNFTNLAKVYSDDFVTSPLGGDVGFLAEHEVYPEVWQRAASLKDGEWAGPVNTPGGFVFVKRIASQAASSKETERLHLQMILVKVFDFDKWLNDQIKHLTVKIYI